MLLLPEALPDRSSPLLLLDHLLQERSVLILLRWYRLRLLDRWVGLWAIGVVFLGDRGRIFGRSGFGGDSPHGLLRLTHPTVYYVCG